MTEGMRVYRAFKNLIVPLGENTAEHREMHRAMDLVDKMHRSGDENWLFPVFAACILMMLQLFVSTFYGLEGSSYPTTSAMMVFGLIGAVVCALIVVPWQSRRDIRRATKLNQYIVDSQRVEVFVESALVVSPRLRSLMDDVSVKPADVVV